MLNDLRALSSLRGLRGAPEVPPLCRETQSLGQQLLNATVGINGFCVNIFCHTPARLGNNRDQTYSCLRDWRLSASWGKLRASWKLLGPSQHYCIEDFKGDPYLSPHYTESSQREVFRGIFIFFRKSFSCQNETFLTKYLVVREEVQSTSSLVRRLNRYC